MKIISITTLLLMAIISSTIANDDVTTCKKCHPIISSEFDNSMHKDTTIFGDKVHKAVWDKHPNKAEDKYTCAKCHTPNSDDKHAGITCLSCHTITDVSKHAKSNTNTYEKRPKTLYSAQKGMEDKKVVYKEISSWLGMIKTKVGSPYHDIDYTNKNYYNANMCMGCHSHKQNSHEFNICTLDDDGAKNSETNCISCHMPKVAGTATTIRKSATHAFHGFAGVNKSPELLKKYIELDFKKAAAGFSISIENMAPHDMLTHPLRVLELRVTIKRAGKSIELPSHQFARIIGDAGKPTMPWLATEVVKNNMIKANETRTVTFDTKLENGDSVEATLGYHIVNPESAKPLGLENEKELIEFKILKSKYFTVN